MNHSSACTATASITATIALLLTACATPGTERRMSAAEQAAMANVAEKNVTLSRYRIRDWSAPNDHTLIVVADDGTRYRAEMLAPCLGLDFAQRLAFVNRGGFQQIDRFSSVVLPDGTRCTFNSFDKLATPESEALDRYERSRETKSPDEDADQRAESETSGDEANPR